MVSPMPSCSRAPSATCTPTPISGPRSPQRITIGSPIPGSRRTTPTAYSRARSPSRTRIPRQRHARSNVGGHPHFVQVMMDSGARAPYGQRQYYPIYEACAKYGYPLAIHPGTDGMGINVQPSPGYPTHYIEWHTCLSLGFQAHLVSFLTEGVFERFPGFRVVLVEGGVAWLPALLWRLDAEWKALRSEVPWVTKLPSAYLRDHVRLSSQPIERPADDRQPLASLEMLDAEHLLMFASDYPHWDFDSPTHAFPKLPAALHERIFSTNARTFYRLG